MPKTGNNHSNLLDQLMDAAEKAVPKTEKSTFADSCIKIASNTPPSLQETLDNLAENVNKARSMKKQAQMELGTHVSPEPNFDEMAGEIPGDPDRSRTRMDETANLEEAKQSLADALIALCGSVEQAVDCLQAGSDDKQDSLAEGDETEPLGDYLEGDELGDDMIPSDILGGDPDASPEYKAMDRPFPR